MKKSQFTMKIIRLILIGLAFLGGESVLQALIVFVWLVSFPVVNYDFDFSFEFFWIVFVFMYFKAVVELWLFLLVTFLERVNGYFTSNGKFLGKMMSSCLMMLILILFVIDERPNSIDIFTVYGIAYPVSVALNYLLLKRVWRKCEYWVN